ncbi:hypothetical protein MAPG_12154 [Magnaporthiopsis poae ATCC 64411]|uniref:Pentatricopeptide repeat protein n=1 Tax=Magnaporthiopsis poae (strain ATCC 64411 / 73-15) TaxID=644358 RepID=A0A0C4EGX6_MAGP6|nr:hypothetical protein MAPG_12154 [Magnaporthiopsis poae ATCC 64411]
MVSMAIAQDPSARDLPSLTEYTQVSLKLKMMNLKDWVATVRGVLEFVCSVDPSPDLYDSLESYELVLGRRTLALESLVDSWKLLTIPRELLATLPPLGGIENVHFAVPTLPSKARKKHDARRHLHLALSEFFPQQSPDAIAPVIPLLIATFIVINDTAICPFRLRAAAAPLLAPMASQLARATARLEPDEAMLGNLTEVPVELADYLTRRWPEVLDQITGTSRSTFGPSGDTHFNRMDLTGADRKPVSVINHDLQAALHNKNVAAIEAIWYDFWGEQPQPDKATCAFLKANIPVFHQFIMMYTARGFPQRSVQVWNAMTSIGIKPDVRTFTAMMDGFKRAKNLRGVQNTWDALVATGLQLDVSAWTARVDGLTSCGKPGDGLRALEEMAVRWEAAEAGRKSNAAHMAVKPSIEPVNAALVGLLRLNGIDAARKLLAWAQRRGIAPDMTTYNTLLRTLVREGTEGAEAVISMMRQQGLQPDDVTVTIILDALVPTIFNKEPEEKIALVQRIISIIVETSTTKNQRAYARLLFLLLRNKDSDETRAVNHVMRHIYDSGQKPTAHIFTIMAQQYLSRDPPAVDLVQSMIETHRLFDDPAIDFIFWERVMDGYLSVEDVDGALGVMSHMRTSTCFTLAFLERLLKALVMQRRMAEADALVKRVKDERLALGEDSDPEGRFWNHNFFIFATECGLHGTGHR